MSVGVACTTYESITGNADVLELLHPSITLLGSESSRNLLENSLESLALRAILGELTADEQVNGVALVGSLGALLPLDAKHSLVESHPPVVGLVTSKTGAVNSRLLSSTKTNDLAVDGVADGVALSVLEGDGGDGKITSSALGEGTSILRGDDGAEGLGGDLDIVAVLLEVDAIDGSGLGRGRVVLGVDLEDEVTATLLLLEDLKSLRFISRSDDTVRNLLGDDLGSGEIDNITESNHVTKAAHAVSTSGTGIGLSKSRSLNALDIVNKVDLTLLLGQGKTNSSTGGRDVLEAGGGRLAESLLKLLDQRPSV